MSLKSRQELVDSIKPRYRQATRKEKQQILDEFVAATGPHYFFEQPPEFAL